MIAAKVSTDFADLVRKTQTFDPQACMHCGICTAVCPLDEPVLPRKLFRYVLLGMEEKVREHIPTIYSCLLCRMCETHCPADVHITENIRYLRNYLNKNEFNL